MEINGKKILICDCEGTIPLDKKLMSKACGGGQVQINTHLCRSQLDNFSKAAGEKKPIVVGCTQEAPLFVETAEKIDSEANIAYVNIRERAGWSKEGDQSNPKIAALIAESTLEAPLATSVSMTSGGSILVAGDNENVIELAQQISNRLDVTCIIKDVKNVMPPRLIEFPIFAGTVKSVNGHLGAFETTVDQYSPLQVSSRSTFQLGATLSDGIKLDFDLVLHISSGTPLVQAPEKRDGYFHGEPNNTVQIQKALFELTDLVGEFEKPRYIKYDPNICVHARSKQTGCTRCLDECPTGAITSSEDEVNIDPYICAGCGNCASVCPTGAAKYELPSGNFLYERLQLLLNTYKENGGINPALLVHDTSYGEDLINTLARTGSGLPSNVLPFAVNEVTQIGVDFMAAALGFGANEILIIVNPNKMDETITLEGQIGLLEAVTSAQGYGQNRVSILDQPDPSTLIERLYKKKGLEPIAQGEFVALGGKREIINLAFSHLFENAPTPTEIVELPEGAPFGTINVKTNSCTLCLSCVTACPTGALKDNPDKPQFTFTETSCVQCGLCKTICPESVISLKPRYNFKSEARSEQIVKEEEPFKCVKCGEPFGVKSSIEKMAEKLSSHSMYSEGQALDRIKMCPDCRVVDMFDEPNTPMAGGLRPKIRTTDDYLREREELREEANNFIKDKGLEKGEEKI